MVLTTLTSMILLILFNVLSTLKGAASCDYTQSKSKKIFFFKSHSYYRYSNL
jgi:hypothetical protein